MPVLINKDTGLAENLPDASALQAGTHEIPLYDPEGNFGSASLEDAQNLMQQGYTQPNSEQLKSIHEKGKYETTEQQLKTGLEGAASAATFGLSNEAEVGLGIAKKEDILKRSEHNPGVHALGELGGLGASMLTGVGEGALLGKAASAVVPTMEATFAGRVGSAAAKGAIENMIFQAGKEHEKAFLGDPSFSAESVLINEGMAGLLGAGVGSAFGAAPELWQATAGKKLNELLSSVKARSGGLPSELKEASGIYVPPEISAALSGSPENERLLQILNESNTKSGAKLQEALTDFHSNIKNGALESLGQTAEDIDAIHSASDYDAGKVLKDGLVSKMKEIVEPISKKYDEFADKFKAAPISAEIRSDMATRVANSISELGLEKASSDVQLKAMNKFLEILPKQENAHDLKLLATNLTEEHPFGSDTYRIGKVLKGIVNDSREQVLSDTLGQKAPELLGEYKATQSAYRDVKGMIDDLNDRLHVGKSYGPDSFMQKIKEAAPEDILRRLSPKGDVELQNLLQKSFPEVSSAVKANELNKLIKSSLTNGELNTKKLFANIQKMQPEHKAFALAPEQIKRIDALQELQSRIPTRMNPSGTARTLDKLWDKIPASAGALGAMLFGHNPVAGYILGSVANYVGKEVPDAARLAMLKFLGTDAEVSASGFRAATQMAGAVAKGEKALTGAVKNIFSAGGKVIQIPDSRAIKVLEEQVKRVADNDPEQQKELLSLSGHTGHYLPDHAAALSMTASRNLQYLASLRPPDKAVNPLDNAPVANSEQQGNYKRALVIAEQPLSVLNNIKQGQLTSTDVQHLRTMYPALYQRISSKATNQMIEHVEAGGKVPYSTRMGLSTLLQHPLDSTMSAQTIVSTQQSMMSVGTSMSMPKTKMEKLDKLPQIGQTPGQAREAHRSR